ncbi:cytochrome P450 [Massariosphaeria phaeospora]|uniref:Cytochrome P450 n=1 Tax=Massariosphaeria phaeospora TaxID=100035 RepID=A0A7C8M2G7_9PLEO|nr:cytochrome P450 [Massariosphaeria phaeospora]
MAMLPENFPYFWALSVLGGIYVIFKLARFGSREKHLPPGPPTYPIVGNAHLVVDKDLYKRHHESLVLNSRRAVHELIDKRSAIYSSRPLDEQYHIALKGENIASMKADACWRAQRKITARFFAPGKLDGDLAKISEAEVTTLMHDLLVTPKDFSKHVDRATASFSSIALFGQRAKSMDDFWATVNAALSPGTYLPTEQFPIFKWVSKRWLASTTRAEQGFSIPTRIWTQARAHVEARRSQGDKRASLMDELLDDESAGRDDVAFHGSPTKLANFVGALMQAAAETSALTMRTSIMFLAANPVPTGIPHRCTEDNWYEGMFIPKDSTIMIPHWSLNHSPSSSPSPSPTTYNPSRYLSHPSLAPTYAASADYATRDHYTYGAGRRICAGMHLAERKQWRMLARLLWAFRIERAVDEHTGKEVDIDTQAYEEKLIAGPKAFQVRFWPRSEEHRRVVEREMEGVRGMLGRWE